MVKRNVSDAIGRADNAARALKDAITANPTQAGLLRQEAGVLGVA